MVGKPYQVGDFTLMYYKCTSMRFKDIIVRSVPLPRAVIWRMFMDESKTKAVCEFRLGFFQTTDLHVKSLLCDVYTCDCVEEPNPY